MPSIKRVMDYSHLNYYEVLNLPCDVFLLMARNSYIDELKSLAEETLVDGAQLCADSLDGKMVVLSFWASYDPVSRINSYDLLRINDDFAEASFEGGSGLAVVCVSLDQFVTPLKKAIEADGTASLTHICDRLGKESPLAKGFDVNRPVNLLMSADGHIVARDFGTNTIRETLEFLRRE